MNTAELTWNDGTGRYENEALWVDGDSYAEARADLTRTLMQEGAADVEAFEQADQHMTDPTYWMDAACDPDDESAGLFQAEQQ